MALATFLLATIFAVESVALAGINGVWLADLSSSLDPRQWPADLNATLPWSFPYYPREPEPHPVPAEITYSNGETHEIAYCGLIKTDENGKSVMVVANSSSLHLHYCTILKEGYQLDHWESLIWGYNSAIIVKNGSQASLISVNVTTHNGAPGFTVEGPWTAPAPRSSTHSDHEERASPGRLDDGIGLLATFQTALQYSTMYSTGPRAPNVLVRSQGFVYGIRNTCFTSGHQSPTFEARDNSNVFCEGCLFHTQGILSPLTYSINASVVTRYSAGAADEAPVAIMDGNGTIAFETAHLTSHNSSMGGIVAMNSGHGREFGTIKLEDTWLVVTGKCAPAIWVGNTQLRLQIERSHIEAASGVLLNATNANIPEGSHTRADIARPADVFVNLANVELKGDIVVSGGSTVNWKSNRWVDWSGASFSSGGGRIIVSLEKGCRWSLTANSTVHGLMAPGGRPLSTSTFSGDLPELENIYGNGYYLHYLADAPETRWLSGREFNLRNGGKLIPFDAEDEPRVAEGQVEDMVYGNWTVPRMRRVSGRI